MMQKRTLYLSLLLVSCLLFFGFSYASAQSVSFQSKTVPRCTDVTLNITVDSPDELSAIELVFEISGDYSSATVDWASGFTCLNDRIGPIIDGNVYRMLAMKQICGGDACCDASGGLVVGEITLHTADVCDGTIEILGATIVSPTGSASTGLVGCAPIVALPTTVVPGTVTIINQAPSITCPADDTIYVHWSGTAAFTVAFDDPDNCENLTLSVTSGPGAVDNSGNYSWTPGGSNVGTHEVTIQVKDKCNATDECSQFICVYNYPPVITWDPADTICAVWTVTLSGQVDATDPDGGPNTLLYEVVQSETDLPTSFGTGLQLNSATGAWTWEIGDTPDYLGNFTLCIKVSDGANIDPPCSPENADSAWYTIHVVGFPITIEKVEKAYQGRDTTVSILLDPAYLPAQICCDLIGGFDFLIAYDASVLTATTVEPGTLIDNDKFEYFTYRYGPQGNCGNGCPSGMLRIVAIRETNDGNYNTYHITGPGELVRMTFYVSNDRTFEGQYIPIRFFWFDCGDNTISDESGKWLYLGLEVFDYGGTVPIDTSYVDFGYAGPAADCYDTVFFPGTVTPKNYPLGAIIFRNGGIDIIPADSIDYRGDINLNGIKNEIADAVMFTNFFIKGLDAFEHIEGSTAASEVNGDGIPLTVADLVYLVRVIVGDAQPLPKVNPNAFAAFLAQGNLVRVESNVDVGAALMVFDGHVIPSLAAEASHLAITYGYRDNTTRVLVYGNWENPDAITSGNLLEVEGNGSLVSVEAAEFRGTTMKTSIRDLPTEFALKQNFPNPFNPITNIRMELPAAADYTLSIYDINGRTVAEYSGFAQAGILTIKWDARNLASGIYFYKFEAGAFSAVKKMVLLK